MRRSVAVIFGLLAAHFAVSGQTPVAGTTADAYVPGVTFQSDNPNYLVRNPFYFEGRIDWNLLKIKTPSNAWEFVQRGIHNQDDLQDEQAAMADYQSALSLNSLGNGTCQILTSAPPGFGQNTSPPPCMFTPRLRLAHLIRQNTPDVAIGLFQEVLLIDPLRRGVNGYIAETYEIMARNSGDDSSRQAFHANAIAAYQSELALSPVTPQTIALTGDKANNAHVHWALSEIYAQLGDKTSQASELQAYLDATQWHGDTYAWRIQLAKVRLARLQQ